MIARRLGTATALAFLVLLAAAGPAAAHTRQSILDGDYQLVVGWRSEPPFAGNANGLDLAVNKLLPDNKTAPVPGLLANLTVTYEYAGRTFTPFDFREAHGRPGAYTGEITPTREGEYTLRVVGAVDGRPFDARVKPHVVESPAETMFPEPDLTREELTAEIAALKAEVAAMKAKAASDPTPTPTQKEATRPTPAAGVLAALAALGAVALVRAGRKE